MSPAAETCRHPVARAFAAALASIGCPVTDDLSGARQEGVAWVDMAIADGERVSAADAYLRPVLDRPNLVVRPGCLVTRLLVRGDLCVGVGYVCDGVPVQVLAAGEVVVCAGAIGSPQVLMLSGIGPADQLRALGIDPVADIAAVGNNLQDHPIAMACYTTASPLAASQYNHGEVYAALRSQHAAGYPDLHLFPILLPLAPPGCQPPEAGFALVAGLVAPHSRGLVRLASTDPQARPVIDPGFLCEASDLDRLGEGLRLVRQAAADAAFTGQHEGEAWPGPSVHTAAGLRGYIRRTVSSYYHPAGTCRMGTDPDAVVDLQLQVRGVAGLRVADASVMPVLSNAHPNATVLAIAERAAELISGAPDAIP